MISVILGLALSLLVTQVSTNGGHLNLSRTAIGDDYERVRAHSGALQLPVDTPETPAEYPEEEERYVSRSGRVLHRMAFLNQDGQKVHVFAAGMAGQLTVVEVCIEKERFTGCDLDLPDLEKRTRSMNAKFVDPKTAEGYYWEFREIALTKGFVPRLTIRTDADGVQFNELTLYPELDHFPCQNRCSVTWVSRFDDASISVAISGSGPNLSLYRVESVKPGP